MPYFKHVLNTHVYIFYTDLNITRKISPAPEINVKEKNLKGNTFLKWKYIISAIKIFWTAI